MVGGIKASYLYRRYERNHIFGFFWQGGWLGESVVLRHSMNLITIKH